MLQARLLLLLLRDVLRDILRHRGQHALAVITLASGLLLAGGGLLLVEGLDRWVNHLESMAKITLYAADGAHLDETEARLKRDPRFVSVRRISSADNTKGFLATTREAGLMLQSLGQEALPETLELTLRPELLPAKKALAVGESLKEVPGVGDVVVDQERLEALQRNARVLRNALSTLGILLLVAAGFATGNVIQMTVQARNDEISIMRLVGATEAFIRRPLILEGAVLGLAGSALALIGLFAAWLPVSRGWGGISPFLVNLAREGFFSWRSILLLAVVGAATGATGAAWAFRATQKEERRMRIAMERAS
ncbi:MAG: FtsX-like permease family protein [Holophagaceae bacterium]|nr:FtsX-like permease family protein [Holophagaceae bacterium]